MRKFDPEVWKLFAIWLIVAVVSGCSGMAKVEMMAPVAPVLEVEVGRPYPYDIGHSRYSKNIITFTRRDLHVEIHPVKLSEQMVAIFGPAVIIPTPASEKVTYGGSLSIDVVIHLKFGRASFDYQDFVVLLGESRRVLKPRQAGTVISNPRFESKERFSFTYEISTEDLSRFVFRLGDINVNGTVVSFPEISFERRSDYDSR